MKILKFKRAVGVWGTTQPKQLLEIINFLTARGFDGPTKDSDLYNLNFTRKINEDLTFTCAIGRVYEDPVNVFNFQSYLILSSRSLHADAVAAKIIKSEMSASAANRVAIFSIGLQHLKWNAEGGVDNPVWQVSTLSQYEHSEEEWIADWNRYAEPILRSMTCVSDVIDFCQDALNYKNNEWVKTDGFYNFEIATWTAMLMTKENRFDDAKIILSDAININEIEVLRASLRESRRMQLQLALDWVEHKLVGSKLI